MILSFRKTIEGTSRPTNFEEKIIKGEKIHTIRSDFNNRWKEGTKIHYANGVRTKYYKCFKEGICTGVQKIEIIHPTEFFNDSKVIVDDKELNTLQKQALAWNDGFDCIIAFLMWFNEDFKGKIIHWTDRRY